MEKLINKIKVKIEGKNNSEISSIIFYEVLDLSNSEVVDFVNEKKNIRVYDMNKLREKLRNIIKEKLSKENIL